MNIAIDLDGTAWKHTEFFVELCKGFKSRGHTIGILTAHNDATCRYTDLAMWAMKGFPHPDFYIARIGEECHIFIGEWKRKMIIENNIDVLFDDFGGNNPDIESTFLEKESGAIILKVIGKEI